MLSLSVLHAERVQTQFDKDIEKQCSYYLTNIGYDNLYTTLYMIGIIDGVEEMLALLGDYGGLTRPLSNEDVNKLVCMRTYENAKMEEFRKTYGDKSAFAFSAYAIFSKKK